MPVEATNMHFVELKLTGNQIYKFWHKVHNMSKHFHNPRRAQVWSEAWVPEQPISANGKFWANMIDRLEELQTGMIDREELVLITYSTHNNLISIKSTNWIVRSVKCKITR